MILHMRPSQNDCVSIMSSVSFVNTIQLYFCCMIKDNINKICLEGELKKKKNPKNDFLLFVKAKMWLDNCVWVRGWRWLLDSDTALVLEFLQNIRFFFYFIILGRKRKEEKRKDATCQTWWNDTEPHEDD